MSRKSGFETKMDIQLTKFLSFDLNMTEKYDLFHADPAIDLRIAHCPGFVEIEAPRWVPPKYEILRKSRIGQNLSNPEMVEKVRFVN